MRHQVVLASDLHGNEVKYHKMGAHVASVAAKVLVIAGDIGPGFDVSSPEDFVESQRRFLRDKFVVYCQQIRRECPGIQIFVIMGNADCDVNLDVLQSGDPEVYRVIHQVRVEINDDFGIVGLPFTPVSSRGLKDFEMIDMDDCPPAWVERNQQLVRAASLSGVFSGQYRDRGKYVLYKDEVDTRYSIQHVLAEMFCFTDSPKNTVYVMHSPPYGTKLDRTYGDHSVGSIAERLYIEQYQPYVTLHGHIHETVAQRSGGFCDMIGETVCLATGNGPFGSSLALVEFDLYDPSNAQRVIL